MSNATEQWCKSSQQGIHLNIVTGIVNCNDCGKELGNFFDDSYKNGNRSTQGHLKPLPVQNKPLMRRFILIYHRASGDVEVEGVQFATKQIVLAFDPDPGVRSIGTREFGHIVVLQAYMKHVLNEFGDTSIRWVDEEVTHE
jgi:hypothetical protein